MRDKLWCLHAIGPDELYPAPSFEAACDAAIRMNEIFAERFVGKEVEVTFEPIEWPWTAESASITAQLAATRQSTARRAP